MSDDESPHDARVIIRTPDQRLRVFVSSTLDELSDERAAVRRAIEQLRLTPVMFEIGARPHAPRDLYRAYLEQSHVFVGIYWQGYGWVAPGEELSGIELEYLSSGSRPKLIYIKTPATDRQPRLQGLLARIQDEDTASYRMFSTPDELNDLVQNDLAVLLTERFEQQDVPTTQRVGLARSNLPIPRNPLVGRHRELLSACEMLQGEVGLLTLIGPGGSGKSRLGLQIALELVGHFEDGVFLVPLEAIRDPALVLPCIASILGVREGPGRPPFEALSDHLRQAHVLLLLDNFEQVIAAATAIAALLESCSQLAVLVTSRVPLRVRTEHRMTVPPLTLPASSQSDVQEASRSAAVALFNQRAKAVSPDFTMTIDNAATVAEICRRLDGLPLAIELAAARVRILTPAALLEKLDHRFELLKGGTRDLPERQQTMRRTIDWSHDLLEEPARRMFRRLSIFAGGTTLEAAESVGTLDGESDAAGLDLVALLLDSSMLTSSVSARGDMRIDMLESMRVYALEQLAGSNEREEIERRHANYYVELAERARPHLVGSEEGRWAERLQAERDNFRAVFEWSHTHDVEIGLRLGTALFRFWESHNLITEGHAQLEKLLDRPSASGLVRAQALQTAASLACYLGRYESARSRGEEALPIFEAMGEPGRIASALNVLGLAAAYGGDPSEGRRLLERSLEIKRELGDEWMIANGVLNLGLVAGYLAENARARERFNESLDLYRRLEDKIGVAIVTSSVALLDYREGRFGSALAGQLSALRLFGEIGDLDGSVECLERLAMLAVAVGDDRRAARLVGLAAKVRMRAGTLPPPFEKAELEAEVAALRDRLEKSTFALEWAAGSELAPEDGFVLAEGISMVRLPPPAGHRVAAAPQPDDEQARQDEIARFEGRE